MGVVNATPDSFSDGGLFAEPELAVARAEALVAHGADIVDVGGESTRPGAAPVPADDEIARVVPVICALAARLPTPISIDTTKAAVAEAAIAAGAEIVNDISGGAFDPDLPAVAADAGAAYVCGHVRGTTLAEAHAAEAAPPDFDDVVAELRARIDGLPPGLRGRTIADPCLGFGKGTRQNVELVRRAGELADAVGAPVLVGPSRKRFLGDLTGQPVAERDDATVGAALAAVAAGAHIVRVHDVARLRPALVAFCAIAREGAA
ncbi:MAG: dihydropteroate synthase [Deltaproteobacteria bacterium]|nr:MAG: dihydropteroate synthase [Deltaproteobacteria bacterium]